MADIKGRHIVGLGGYIYDQKKDRRLYQYVLGLTGKDKPSVLYVPTAQGDSPEKILAFYENLNGLGELSHLKFFPWPPENLKEFVLSQDAISISGGNTANMLAIWRVYGFDKILREAWEKGIVLFGASAGMMCWFEAGVTDSFGPHLEGMRDGLGFLKGSACPHYDGEELRKPRYHELIKKGFPEGIAVDNGVAVHYLDTNLHEVVTCQSGSSAYIVSAKGERALQAREL